MGTLFYRMLSTTIATIYIHTLTHICAAYTQTHTHRQINAYNSPLHFFFKKGLRCHFQQSTIKTKTFSKFHLLFQLLDASFEWISSQSLEVCHPSTLWHWYCKLTRKDFFSIATKWYVTNWFLNPSTYLDIRSYQIIQVMTTWNMHFLKIWITKDKVTQY